MTGYALTDIIENASFKPPESFLKLRTFFIQLMRSIANSFYRLTVFIFTGSGRTTSLFLLIYCHNSLLFQYSLCYCLYWQLRIIEKLCNLHNFLFHISIVCQKVLKEELIISGRGGLLSFKFR